MSTPIIDLAARRAARAEPPLDADAVLADCEELQKQLADCLRDAVVDIRAAGLNVEWFLDRCAAICNGARESE